MGVFFILRHCLKWKSKWHEDCVVTTLHFKFLIPEELPRIIVDTIFGPGSAANIPWKSLISTSKHHKDRQGVMVL